MALTAFRLDFYGDTQIARKFERFALDIENAIPLWESLFSYLAKLETRQFNTQGEAGGERWAALADSTKKAKARKGLDPRILHATLALRKSLVSATGGEYSIRVAEAEFMEFGTTLKYAGVHQHGGAHIPQRRPVNLTEAQRKEVTKRIQRYIITGKAG